MLPLLFGAKSLHVWREHERVDVGRQRVVQAVGDYVGILLAERTNERTHTGREQWWRRQGVSRRRLKLYLGVARK